MTWPGERARTGGVDEVPLPAAAGGGRLLLCGKHHVGPDVEAALDAIGASTVVCLVERHELADRYPHYVAWLDHHAGGRVVWAPTPDLHAPPVERAVDLVDEIIRRLRDGERVVLQCGAGIGRAGTMAAAVLMGLGEGLEAALVTVAASRPMAGPEAGAQRALLEALARRIAQR